MQPDADGEVLVIRLGALGDVMLALPHLARIMESFPHSRVTLLTAPQYRELAEAVPGLEVAAFPRRGFIAMWRVLCWLLGRRFGTVFDLQGSTRSRIMTLLTRARRRIGRRPGIAYTRVPHGGQDAVHAFQRVNELLVTAGIAPVMPGEFPLVADRQAPAVAAWLGRHAPGERKLVLMHAGSSRRWPSKRWEESHYIELAQQLEALGFTVVWIGGEEDRELNRRLACAAGVDACGEFSVTDLMALGRRAVFAISNDSGPMHVLSAAGIPVYAFFGPTDWRRSHAVGQQEHVLLNPVPCSPCHLKACPPAHRHECLADISAGMVMDRLQADRLIGR